MKRWSKADLESFREGPLWPLLLGCSAIVAFGAMFLFARFIAIDEGIARSAPPTASAASLRTPAMQGTSTRQKVHAEQAEDRGGARHASDVPIEAVEKYFVTAKENLDATAAAKQRWADLVAHRGLDAANELECRGSVCRVIMRFESKQKIKPLLGARPPSGTEFTYQMQKKPDGSFAVAVYYTASGTRFAELL